MFRPSKHIQFMHMYGSIPRESFHTSPSLRLSQPGKSYTMIGRDDSLQTLGIIPCAISWLFKLINERKEKTGARFSVRVSAVEVSVTDEVELNCLRNSWKVFIF